MDSLTQIILGAAAGEVVLGKKIGNRAMLWGAVGGTIPDLDVLGKFFLSNIDNLAFHRAISHSVLFSVVGAFVFGWVVHKLYQNKHHKWVALVSKTLATILVGFAVHFVFQIFMPGNYVPTIVGALLLGALLFFTSRKKYFTNSWKVPDATLKKWQLLFFWALITHPLLDCFTMYGTQLFAPFSNYRVAWNTISVVDPLYTAPFLICLIVASFYHRTTNKRRVWNYAGIAISSLYMLFTVFNKFNVNTKFTDAMETQNITAQRFITGPSILNNILWSCTAETDSNYYIAQYSLFDEVPIHFNEVPKNHHLIKNLDTDPTVKTLRWFSKDYFNVFPGEGDSLLFNDLRWGIFGAGQGDKKEDYIFSFRLIPTEDGYDFEEGKRGSPKGGAKAMINLLWTRIKGFKRS